ncbi:hypothetical protein LTR37_000977 [Vermiconidia calcicola]|uniref:Uncharacterized protein n=1 Tax=Vermiconidia calcicola TaxID=1690605 RepID=A0ACC3NWF4_9PEZI|nr:hypothetical protein LTR37_000977 [Vermiconidia calcicola]
MDPLDGSEMSLLDPQIAALSTPPYPEVPPQQDVDEFLRKKRKAREHKACYPCRQRKVKDREHPELCSYHPPSKRQNVDHSASSMKQEDMSTNGGLVTLGRGEFDFLCRKLNTLENSIADLRRELNLNAQGRSASYEADANAGAHIDPAVEGRPQRPTHADVHGVHVKNDVGEIVHLGAGSIPAMFYALQMNQSHAEQHQIQEVLGKTVLPLFGLDNESATYPFVDLWGLPHGSLARAQEIAKALPSDSQMLNLFRCYRDVGYVTYAGIASVEELESAIPEFLNNRAAQFGSPGGVTEQQIYGKSFNWLGLLFAVLASGAQCSGMPRKERELTSQVYICCSFECLRFTNFLSQATIESIQSLVVIGNVMTNNLNAGTSWSLLGLTIRLAQGLGLHRVCPPNIPREVVYPRSKVWWSIVWQDSLLSITYDRASVAGALDASTMPPPQEFGPTCAYHAAMYRVSKVGLEIVRDRIRPMEPREQTSRIQEHKETLATILRDSAEYLRDSRKCSTSRETLEHWALYLHSSYHMSELCRPAISPNSDPELSRLFKQVCIDNLVNTVEAFLGLNNVTSFARQSWAALHRALGSALLLGILGEHTRNERARRLLTRFINVMTDITNSVDPQEISSPIQRGLAALSKLGFQEARTAQVINSMAFGTKDKIAIAEDGSIKIESSAITPNSNPMEENHELSPYSVLNTILWGNNEGYPT